MALFQILKGLKANLPSTKTEGYCYFTIDDGKFYIDCKDIDGSLQRKPLNANTATKLEKSITIALAGDISGNASFDGSGNITITTATTDALVQKVIDALPIYDGAISRVANAAVYMGSDTPTNDIGVDGDFYLVE